jgi:hypothetical protein
MENLLPILGYRLDMVWFVSLDVERQQCEWASPHSGDACEQALACVTDESYMF